jgi:RNA polymerase sigma factor (sigma-70 family)
MPARETPVEFENFFDRMFPPVVKLATRLVGSDDAEDVAVEALARALDRWGRVVGMPHRDAWVMRVAANVALDQLRRDRRRREPVPTEAQSEEEGTALRLTVRAALDHLPRRQAEVLTLRYLADLGEDDVAGALGISLGSVKTHARRGLSALRLREELFDVR